MLLAVAGALRAARGSGPSSQRTGYIPCTVCNGWFGGAGLCGGCCTTLLCWPVRFLRPRCIRRLKPAQHQMPRRAHVSVLGAAASQSGNWGRHSPHVDCSSRLSAGGSAAGASRDASPTAPDALGWGPSLLAPGRGGTTACGLAGSAVLGSDWSLMVTFVPSDSAPRMPANQTHAQFLAVSLMHHCSCALDETDSRHASCSLSKHDQAPIARPTAKQPVQREGDAPDCGDPG